MWMRFLSKMDLSHFNRCSPSWLLHKSWNSHWCWYCPPPVWFLLGTCIRKTSRIPFFTDCVNSSVFTAPCIVIRRYWHIAPITKFAFCRELAFSLYWFLHEVLPLSKSWFLWYNGQEFNDLAIFPFTVMLYVLTCFFLTGTFILSTCKINTSFERNESFTKAASSSTK